MGEPSTAQRRTEDASVFMASTSSRGARMQ
jgi:hypothetical protein